MVYSKTLNACQLAGKQVPVFPTPVQKFSSTVFCSFMKTQTLLSTYGNTVVPKQRTLQYRHYINLVSIQSDFGRQFKAHLLKSPTELNRIYS